LFRITRAGDGSPEGERLQEAEERERRRTETYGGYDFVFGKTAIAEIVRVIDPQALGVEPVSDRRFAARHGDFIKILEIAAFKGASYAPRWGVSLPYVPLALKKPLRYGRTLKSARLSLWWDTNRDTRLPQHARTIDSFHGIRAVRDDTSVLWLSSRQAVLDFWSETSDLAGVLQTAIRQKNAPDSPLWLPNAGVVAALTAARLGDEPQALRFAREAPTRDNEGELLTDLIRLQLSLAR